ncbi:uncharacterized protein PV09_00502, partial [Verruconis gallopava]
MPRPNKTISPAQKAALLECFQFATALVPVALRPQFLLVGGTASIAFSSPLWTDDVDVAASAEAIIAFRQAIAWEGSSFAISPCQMIEFDSRQGFRVSLELLQLGGAFVESIAVAEPCYNGFVASLADLILNRAKTVVGCGEIGDVADLRFLLEEAARRGMLIPVQEEERREVLLEAAKELIL